MKPKFKQLKSTYFREDKEYKIKYTVEVLDGLIFSKEEVENPQVVSDKVFLSEDKTKVSWIEICSGRAFKYSEDDLFYIFGSCTEELV